MCSHNFRMIKAGRHTFQVCRFCKKVIEVLSIALRRVA